MKVKHAALTAACLLAGCQVAQKSVPVTGSSNKFPVAAPAHLDFDKQAGVQQSFELDGQTVRYRAFENIVYVFKLSDMRYQTMNIYIPEAYFDGGSMDGYNAQTAPIFFSNNVGGYMPTSAGKPEPDKRSGNTPNAMMVALSKGCVVASARARPYRQRWQSPCRHC